MQRRYAKKCRLRWMPKSVRKKVKRCVRKLQAEGYDQSAYPICINSVAKSKSRNIIVFSAII